MYIIKPARGATVSLTPCHHVTISLMCCNDMGIVFQVMVKLVANEEILM